jgi:hypothetical protein
MLALWLDNVPFDTATWRDVRHVKWNADRPMSFTDEETFDFDYKYQSAIRDDELLEKRDDRSFWAISGVD